jgi:hypothetical protein
MAEIINLAESSACFAGIPAGAVSHLEADARKTSAVLVFVPIGNALLEVAHEGLLRLWFFAGSLYEFGPGLVQCRGGFSPPRVARFNDAAGLEPLAQ